MTTLPGPGPVDDAIDRAIAAMNRGEADRALALAREILAGDDGNRDATDLLTLGARPEGELRRLTIMFCDLVGSTELSQRLDTEDYREVVAHYGRRCRAAIEDELGGWLVSFKGDGVLAAWGFPDPHENDVERAVRAGLRICESIAELTGAVRDTHGEAIGVRVAVHKGLVVRDLEERDLYGFAVNLAARLEGMAAPGTVLVSEDVRRLVADRFDFEAHEPRTAKGVAEPVLTHTVLGTRSAPLERPRRPRPSVGRTDEVEQLRAAWTAACAGDRAPGACVAVLGEAGIGKSNLVAALEDEVRAVGAAVVRLAGSPFHTEAGLWPVRHLLEVQAGFHRDLDGPERLERLDAERARVGLEPTDTPLLAALAGLGPDAGYEPHESDARQLREDVIEAGARYLERLVGELPALLLFEDAHWFDDTTREVVGRFVRGALDHVAVVVTSRDAAAVPRGSGTTTIELAPLAYPERMQLLQQLGGDALPLDDLLTIADRSDGVPLYLEELLHGAVDGGPGAAVAVTGDEPIGVPEALYEPLVARLTMNEAGAAVAAPVAVIGRDADLDTLELVCALPAAELRDAVEGLVASAVLEWVDGGRRRVRFRHELQRSVVYEIQPPSRRRELHGRVATALVKRAPDDDSVDWLRVADHQRLAGNPVDAAIALDHAALVARRRGALLEARGLLARAVELVEDDVTRPVDLEISLRLQRGFLQVLVDGPASPTAAADYERCLALTLDESHRDDMRRTLVALWPYYLTRGNFERGRHILDTLVASTSSDDLAFRFFAAAGHGLMAGYRGEFAEALAQTELALSLVDAEAVTDYALEWTIPIDPRASNYAALGMYRLAGGDPAAAVELFDAARHATGRLPFPQGPFSNAGNLTFEVWLQIEIGDFDAAAEVLAELTAIAQRHSFDSWNVVAMTQREIVDGLRAVAAAGDDDERRAAAARHALSLSGYLGMWKALDQYVFLPWYYAMLGSLLAEAGDTDAATAAFDEAAAIAESSGQRFNDSEILRRRAVLAADPPARAAVLHDAIATSQRLGTVWGELRAALDLHDLTGDAEPLTAALGRSAPHTSGTFVDEARRRLSAR